MEDCELEAVELFAQYLKSRIGMEAEINEALQDFFAEAAESANEPSDDFPMYLEYDDWKED